MKRVAFVCLMAALAAIATVHQTWPDALRRSVAAAVAGPQPAGDAPASFAQSGADATELLEKTWYVDGSWRLCSAPACAASVSDWGADSLTAVLFLRWQATKDPAIAPYMRRLLARAPYHAAPCAQPGCETWSDAPLWDAVAALRESAVARDRRRGVRVAARAFAVVDGAPGYRGGACPDILYQRFAGRSGGLKTLETDSNYIKAALLLYGASGNATYRDKAVRHYAAVRRRYFDARAGLYTTYVFDRGSSCVALPRRFFASVNGNMIWNGLELTRVTGDARYRSDALATARAVNRSLGDAARVFVPMQASNDVVEPLVEGMLRVATETGAPFARQWILRNAAAARSGQRSDGNYGRFLDGPPSGTMATAWETNGGLALQVAAATLSPGQTPRSSDAWKTAQYVSNDVRALPAVLRFQGSAIALVGTVGEQCCEAGHARLFIDGVETVSRTGIWQNKSSAGFELPGSILFAWRWPRPGTHTLRFVPGTWNAKEGGSFLHLAGYYVE